MLTTDQKGAVAESAIIHEAIKLGIGVYKPVMEGGRYDLILDLGTALLRTQCKWAPLHDDVVVIRCYSNRRAREGLRRRRYSASEVDVIAAYCPELDRSFLLLADHFDGRTQLLLRVAPSRNNQRAGVNWGDDYAFADTLMALAGP